MNHGVQGFFLERSRAGRRVAVIAASLALAGLLPFVAILLPPFQQPMRTFLNARFGYEGRDQYVRRISLQAVRGTHVVTREIGSIDTRRARAGGGVRARPLKDLRAVPEVRPDLLGPGMSEADLLQRAVSRLADIPVVQSEDLIIEHASAPIYPEAEIEKGIEGRVMVQALVDTTGRVVDVQLLASTGVPPFERSAAEAVWQYRFRPYRPDGITREVYAVFRFSFRIY
jgi:TonB family protein